MKKIKIYQTNNNELIASSLADAYYVDAMTPVITSDNVIADGDLPPLAENQAYKVSGNRNADGHYTVSANVSVVADYRNIETYNTQTGELEKVTEIGDLPSHLTTKPRPGEYHTWNGSKWTLTAAAKKQQLADAKKAKLAELNSAAESYIEQVTKKSETPSFERATWAIQAKEAKNWQADNAAATPNLSRIATARGIDINVLRQKAYAKATQYEILASTIAGQRQKHEDLIKSATSLTALNKIQFEIGIKNET